MSNTYNTPRVIDFGVYEFSEDELEGLSEDESEDELEGLSEDEHKCHQSLKLINTLSDRIEQAARNINKMKNYIFKQFYPRDDLSLQKNNIATNYRYDGAAKLTIHLNNLEQSVSLCRELFSIASVTKQSLIAPQSSSGNWVNEHIEMLDSILEDLTLARSAYESMVKKLKILIKREQDPVIFYTELKNNKTYNKKLCELAMEQCSQELNNEETNTSSDEILKNYTHMHTQEQFQYYLALFWENKNFFDNCIKYRTSRDQLVEALIEFTEIKLSEELTNPVDNGEKQSAVSKWQVISEKTEINSDEKTQASTANRGNPKKRRRSDGYSADSESLERAPKRQCDQDYSPVSESKHRRTLSF